MHGVLTRVFHFADVPKGLVRCCNKWRVIDRNIVDNLDFRVPIE